MKVVRDAFSKGVNIKPNKKELNKTRDKKTKNMR